MYIHIYVFSWQSIAGIKVTSSAYKNSLLSSVHSGMNSSFFYILLTLKENYILNIERKIADVLMRNNLGFAWFRKLYKFWNQKTGRKYSETKRQLWVLHWKDTDKCYYEAVYLPANVFQYSIGWLITTCRYSLLWQMWVLILCRLHSIH